MPSSARPRLLIIDDEPRMLHSLKDLLSDLGEVFISTNGFNVLALIQEHKPDLILLDIQMPGMDGFEVCSVIKGDPTYTNIPVIFITGNSDSTTEIKALDASAADFISKPFNISRVKARIKTQLTLKQKNEELRFNVNARKEAEERERHLKNLYRAKSEINRAIVHQLSEEALFDLVCRLVVEFGGMRLAWVGIPDKQSRFVPVASFGTAVQYLYEITVSSSPDIPEGQGPSGIAFREGTAVVANEFLKNSKTSTWSEKAQQYGIFAGAAFPIMRSGRPYAMLAVYSNHADAFDDDIEQLLNEMSASIGFALDNIDRETARRQAEDALKESEERLRSVIDNSASIIYLKDRHGRYALVNREFNKFFQSASSELLGKTDFELFSDQPMVADRIWMNDLQIARSGESLQFEEEIELGDGQHIYFSTKFPVHDASGAITGIGGVSIDITERKRNEIEKAQLSEQRQIALDAARLGSWRYDPLSNMVNFDKRYGDIHGFVGEQLRDEEIFLLIHPDDQHAVRAKFAAALNPAGPVPYQVEYRIILPDRSVSWIEAFGIASFEGEGDKCHATSMSGTISDITERKSMEEELRESEIRLNMALDSGQMGMWDWDIRSDRSVWNNKEYELLGLPVGAGREPTERFFQHVHPDDLAKFRRDIAVSLETSDDWRDEVRIIRQDGAVRWLAAIGRVRRDEYGNPVRMIGVNFDITERKIVEEDLKLAAAVYRDSSEAMMVTDENNTIITVNQAFTEITGFEQFDVIGKTPSILKSGHQDAAFYQDMWAEIRSYGRYKGELWNRKKDGQYFAAQLTINTVNDGDGKPHRYVGLMSDITEKKRSDDLIWLQANFDTLTGLPNRRFFRDRLEHEVRNAKRSRLPLALMFIDLDGFKDVNDMLGHDMGDLLLKEAAERLRRCTRETDTVARLGGDEFTIILTELHDPGNVDRVAHHILRALSEPIRLGKELAYVSASIGITLFPDDATDVENMLRNADQAMYSAKEKGKNRYHYFTPSMQAEALKRMRIINDMRGALEAGQFEIVYQPIVELSSGKIMKAEALIRWQHPTKGLLNPIEFISTAEDTGMISAFGNWVFHEAAKQAAIWRERYHPGFQISLNISPVQFRREGIVPSVWIDHLKQLGLPGKGIVVEITEGLLLDGPSKVTDQLLILRDAGIEVALDDFGTGYSALLYLQKFDIDYIKIDQDFVQNLTAGSANMALCEAMIVMAHKLNIKVIAEGVETPLQHELLANGGCDFAQGYRFSKPVLANELEMLIKDNPFSTQNSLNI